MTLAVSAYLKVCTECHQHASIVTADASIQPEFACKVEGFNALKAALADGHLFEDEAKIVHQQIADSDLPYDRSGADLMVLLDVARLNVHRFDESAQMESGVLLH